MLDNIHHKIFLLNHQKPIKSLLQVLLTSNYVLQFFLEDNVNFEKDENNINLKHLYILLLNLKEDK